ncbi:MAG: ABC transporter permease subunit [Chitinivibrionales bacterium]
MRNFLKITAYSIVDLVHHKSFYVMLTISIFFVLLLKGCYKGDYMVNGQRISPNMVAWNASIVAFHIVAAGTLLIATLLSLGIFRRDKDDGSMTYILSKPVSRIEYAFGKIAGLWVVSFLFMFVLHLTITVITYFNTGGVMPGYLAASLVCSFNVLFMVLLVSLLSLVLHDFAAAFLSVGIVAISFISDTIDKVAHSDLLKTAMASSNEHLSFWRILWPKVCSLQYFAESLIDQSKPHQIGPLHPSINILVFIVIAAIALVWRFEKEEI